MIKLLKNANVYAPEKLGKKDILIEGEKILLMQDSIEGYEGLPGVETLSLIHIFWPVFSFLSFVIPSFSLIRDSFTF